MPPAFASSCLTPCFHLAQPVSPLFTVLCFRVSPGSRLALRLPRAFPIRSSSASPLLPVSAPLFFPFAFLLRFFAGSLLSFRSAVLFLRISAPFLPGPASRLYRFECLPRLSRFALLFSALLSLRFVPLRPASPFTSPRSFSRFTFANRQALPAFHFRFRLLISSLSVLFLRSGSLSRLLRSRSHPQMISFPFRSLLITFVLSRSLPVLSGTF